MPLPLVAHVPSTARKLYPLDELEPVPSKKRQVIGNYTLVEHLGAGSSGSNVFAATRPDSKEVFAVKVLRGGCAGTACGLPRFLREAELTCQLDHPHVASGIASGVDGADHFLVMKLLRGKSLEEVVQDFGRLNWKMATMLILHLARSLEHLKSLGIIHRDVKPENIMITKNGASAEDSEPLVHSSCNGAAALGLPADELTAVLIDMGLARKASDLADDGVRGSEPPLGGPAAMPSGPTSDTQSAMRRVATPAWSAIGSPGFMAPEQIRDARTASHPADVYGLGTTWYVLLTGVLPFTGSNPHRVMQQALHSEVVPVSTHLPSVPAAVEVLILWILQKDPNARPPIGPTLTAMIEAVLAAPEDATHVTRAREAHEKRRRWQDMLVKGKQGAVVVAGLLVFAGLVWETLTLEPEAEQGALHAEI